MKILGIDPGKFGWWCLLDTESDTAVARQLRWSSDGILIWRDIPKADRIFMEKVHAIPTVMNARSAFSFGYSVGQLHAFTSASATTLVTPQNWQKICLEGIDTNLDPKERSKAGFAKLNPSKRDKKLNHNFTDAYHIANYGLLKHGILKQEWTFANHQEIWKR
jgi:hypothetical protein